MSDESYAENLVSSLGYPLQHETVVKAIVKARQDARLPAPIETREGFWVNEASWRYQCSCKQHKACDRHTREEVCKCGVVWSRPSRYA